MGRGEWNRVFTDECELCGEACRPIRVPVLCPNCRTKERKKKEYNATMRGAKSYYVHRDNSVLDAERELRILFYTERASLRQDLFNPSFERSFLR